jgi:hypothetical protein
MECLTHCKNAKIARLQAQTCLATVQYYSLNVQIRSVRRLSKDLFSSINVSLTHYSVLSLLHQLYFFGMRLSTGAEDDKTNY